MPSGEVLSPAEPFILEGLRKSRKVNDFSFLLVMWEAAQLLEDPHQAMDPVSRSALRCFLSVGEPEYKCLTMWQLWPRVPPEALKAKRSEFLNISAPLLDSQSL